MLVYVAIVAALAFSYLRLPEAFLPSEDQGYMIVDVQLPPGATSPRTERTVEQMEQHFISRDSVANVVSVMGFSFSGMGQNAALAFPTLVDWSDRGSEESVMAEAQRANESLAGIEDGTIFAVVPPSVDGLGTSGGFALRLQDRAALGREAFVAARNELLMKANSSPIIAYAMMEGLEDAPQLRLNIDRAKAETLGVSFSDLSATISSAFGSALINEFTNFGRMQKVVVQADVDSRMTPEDIKRLYVSNRQGEQVPLEAFVDMEWETGPVQFVRYNGYPAFKISGDAAPGYSSGEAMAEMERLVSELPRGVEFEWTGLSFQEKVAGAQAPILLGLALVVVFLLLVALYESWAIPLSVILIVPIGALGAVLAVTLLGMSNDVYFKVGLITIIGLAAKNAILIVEFAKDLYAEGHSLSEAGCYPG